MSYVVADRLANGRWDCYCVHCQSSIGVLTGEQVGHAVLRTAGRGGVLCTECRQRCCDDCGYISMNARELYQAENRRICNWCFQEMQDPSEIELPF